MYGTNDKGSIKQRRKEIISSQAEREYIPLQIVNLAMSSVRILSDKRCLTSSKSTDDGQMDNVQMDIIDSLIRTMGKWAFFVEANAEWFPLWCLQHWYESNLSHHSKHPAWMPLFPSLTCNCIMSSQFDLSMQNWNFIVVVQILKLPLWSQINTYVTLLRYVM